MDRTIVHAQNVKSRVHKCLCNLVCYPQVSKYDFNKWINERTQIYVIRVPPQRSAKSTMIKRLRMHEKASIWECFFVFTVCQENTIFQGYWR